jgi:hypothetical protein
MTNMRKVWGLAPLAVVLIVACQSNDTRNGGRGNAKPTGDAGQDATHDVEPDAQGDAEPDAPSSFCSVPSDCTAYAFGSLVCCIENTCLSGQAAETQTCADAAAQNITASSYDQTCQSDSDCVSIAVGNFCVPSANSGCPSAAINKGALAQYQADLAKTQASACTSFGACPNAYGIPCCQSGSCTMSGSCGTVLMQDASGDTGSIGADRSDAGDSSRE